MKRVNYYIAYVPRPSGFDFDVYYRGIWIASTKTTWRLTDAIADQYAEYEETVIE